MTERKDRFILTDEEIVLHPPPGGPKTTLTAQELEEARARVAAGEDVDAVAAELARRKADEAKGQP